MRNPWAAVGLALLGGLAIAATTATDKWFNEVSKQAGVDKKHTNRAFENPYAVIMAGYTALGASATVADFDGDGLDDVYVTDSAVTGKNHLYKNKGDFTFVDVAEQAGVANANDPENAVASALWF